MSVSKRILVIDDSEVVRLYTRHVLERLGFEVCEARNGVEGLERLSSEPVELALVDVNMTKMNGYEFVRALRAKPHALSIPVIMVSSEQEASDREQAFAAGANFYLLKPVKADELSVLVRRALGSGEGA